MCVDQHKHNAERELRVTVLVENQAVGVTGEHQGNNPSYVIFRLCTQFFRACYLRVAWMFRGVFVYVLFKKGT